MYSVANLRDFDVEAVSGVVGGGGSRDWQTAGIVRDDQESTAQDGEERNDAIGTRSSSSDLQKLHAYAVLSALTTATSSSGTDDSIELDAVNMASEITETNIDGDDNDGINVDADYLKVAVTSNVGSAAPRDVVPMLRRGSEVYRARQESNFSPDVTATNSISETDVAFPDHGSADIAFERGSTFEGADEDEDAAEEEAVLDILDSLRVSFVHGASAGVNVDELNVNRDSAVSIKTAEMEAQQAEALAALSVSTTTRVISCSANML